MGPRPAEACAAPGGSAAPAIDREGLDGVGTLLRDDELVAARQKKTCTAPAVALESACVDPASGARPRRLSVKPLMLPLPPALST